MYVVQRLFVYGYDIIDKYNNSATAEVIATYLLNDYCAVQNDLKGMQYIESTPELYKQNRF